MIVRFPDFFSLFTSLFCYAAVAYSVADRWSTELSGVTLKLSPNCVQVIYFKKVEAICIVSKKFEFIIWNIFVFVTAST